MQRSPWWWTTAAAIAALISCAQPQSRPLNPAAPRAATERPAAAGVAVTEQPEPAPHERVPLVQEIDDMGISVVCSVTPLPADEHRDTVRAGDDVQVRFEIIDQTSGQPLSSLNPAAWIDRRSADVDETCHQMVQSFLTGSLSARAEYDLNVFYVLTLNDEASITVVDPLFSYGGSRLLAMIRLPSPGEDWVLSEDQSRLFVSMPLINQVAMIDTATWEVIHRFDVAMQPTRLVIQPDEKYVWVSCVSPAPSARAGLVVAIDPDGRKVVTQIAVGTGHHEIAFSTDSSHAFVTNRETATVSVIDVQRLKPIESITLEGDAGGVVYSSVSQSAYVVDSNTGTIVVIDGCTNAVTRRIIARPGLSTIRIAPGDRYVFVANSVEDTIDIIDVATNAIIHTVDVGPEPDQIVFTLNLAYIRSRGSEIVLMIPLDQMGVDGPIGVVDFSGGHTPFGVSEHTSLADGIAPAPSGLATVIANPVDKSIYYYREGMAAPMGEFSNYGRAPRAVMVVDRSLHETSPGTYGTTVHIDEGGAYHIAFLLDVPRILHCFDLWVADKPKLASESTAQSVHIAVSADSREVTVGEPIRLTYTVRDGTSGAPVRDLEDLRVLTFSTRNWHHRQSARQVKDGVYETTFVPPYPGIYYAFCQVPSLSLQYRDVQSIVLRALAKE